MNEQPRIHPFLIFYVATIIFFAVGAITQTGLSWYTGLVLPSWIPSETTVAALWCLLFVSSALSLLNFWNRAARGGWSRKEQLTVFFYMANAALVLLWNYAFFALHQLGFALLVACLVGLSAVAIMARTWRNSKSASYLLAPYVAWMIFAVYFSYALAVLN